MSDDRGHHFDPRRDPILHPRARRAACTCGWKGRWHYDPSQPGRGRVRGEGGFEAAYREWADHAAEAR